VDQDLQNRWFDFGGEAYVNTNKHIRLTQDRQSETGWLWSRLPITVSNYQIDIEFKVSGGASHLFGDGMAIWLTQDRAEYGPVFGSKDAFKGVGIFIDTYANARHSYNFPRITSMIGDGAKRYDQGSDGDTNSAGACSANVRRNDLKTMVRLIYLKKEDSLEVLLQYKGWDEWTPCFTIQNVTIPTSPYLGVTAITGEVHDAHDVISIASSSIILKADRAEAHKQAAEKTKARKASASTGSSTGWLGFILKICVFGGFCAAAFQAYKIYYLQDGRWSNKRF